MQKFKDKIKYYFKKYRHKIFIAKIISVTLKKNKDTEPVELINIKMLTPAKKVLEPVERKIIYLRIKWKKAVGNNKAVRVLKKMKLC
jgi:hypothetical protein